MQNTKLSYIENDVFDIINKVSTFYDITNQELLTSNKADCVDARYSAINMLCDKYTDYDINRATKLSKSCINKIRNNFRDKIKNPYFRENYRKLCLQLENK